MLFKSSVSHFYSLDDNFTILIIKMRYSANKLCSGVFYIFITKNFHNSNIFLIFVYQ
jgi:hypothetical protein